MKKILPIIVILSVLAFSNVSLVSAQDEGSTTTTEEQPDINEGTAPPIGGGEEEAEGETPTGNVSSEDKNQTFINGALAGGLVGLVVGSVVMWLFKDKFYK